MKSLIDITDLSKNELEELIRTAEDIRLHPESYRESCKGKKLATLFFEPSTRTRLSFESAMYSLGGDVLSVTDPASSSVAKGETVADTARTVSCFADMIVIRHPKEGAAFAAAESAKVPVINAGDGGHCHPTQTLADILTVWREKGRLNDLTVGLCGDLKYGRTVHSLINALSRYNGIKLFLISPEELKLPEYIKNGVIREKKLAYTETNSLEEALPKLDILYMTRIQRERFENSEAYERLKDSFILDAEKMKLASADCSVMHPLPRVNEISPEVDEDPRACYFRQVENGRLMRMALILKLLYGDKSEPAREYISDKKCANPRCITSVEPGIRQKFIKNEADGSLRCAYCEAKPGKDQ